ncbi:hypothetical protein FB451DRAFT_1360542 [Mycena latifolia]|nr:hypothetical protein FB451DRAFT_1360542 [Mycena latifolia]
MMCLPLFFPPSVAFWETRPTHGPSYLGRVGYHMDQPGIQPGDHIVRQHTKVFQYAEKILGGIDIKLTIFMTGYHDDTYEDKEYGVTSAARRDDGDGPDANGGPTRAKWRKSECGDRDVPRKGSANEPTQLSAASKTRREAGGTLDECAELGRSGLEVDGDEVDVARGRRRTDVGAL